MGIGLSPAGPQTEQILYDHTVGREEAGCPPLQRG